MKVWIHDGPVTDEDRRRFLEGARRHWAGVGDVIHQGPAGRVIYLSGSAGPELDAHLHRHDLGVMVQPGTSSYLPRYRGRVALDNGCFAAGEDFDIEAWLAWLDDTDPRLALFATAPDVVGDAVATWARGGWLLDYIRDRGHAAAYVAQDGLTVATAPWGAFDVLFLGGTTRWKLGPVAAALAGEAHRRGLWVHMGRVNSHRRLRYAVSIGCSSVDGTFLKHAPGVNVPRMLRWLDRIEAERTLW